jgi:hypothetical protein
VLADFSRNLEVKLLDCVPLLNQINVLLACKFFVKHFPHLHASLDVEHQLGYFVWFHTDPVYGLLLRNQGSTKKPVIAARKTTSFKYSLDPMDQLIHGIASEIQIYDRIGIQFVFGRVT